LIGEGQVPDPRSAGRSIEQDGTLIQPLTRQPGGLQAYKMTFPASRDRPRPQQHDGYEWLYVLSGRLRLVLAHHDVVLEAGEAAEFDTNLPHWFGSTGEGAVEMLSLFGPDGQRLHLRTRRRTGATGD
jgi:quercetin dioxygenase-like cupin family protein